MLHSRSFAAATLALSLLLVPPLLAADTIPADAAGTYNNVAFLYVNPIKSDDGRTIENDAMWQRAIQSEAVLVRGEAVFQAVVASASIRETRWYAALKDPATAIAALKRDLRVEPLPGTALIGIWVENQAADGAQLADAVAAARLEQVREIAHQKQMNKAVELKAERNRCVETRDSLVQGIADLVVTGAATRPVGQLDVELRRDELRRLSDRLAAITDKLAELHAAEPDLAVRFAKSAR
jgi:hypothetical protein